MTPISASAESTYSALTTIQGVRTRRLEQQLRDATQRFDEATAALQACRDDVDRADERLLDYRRSAAERTKASLVVDAQRLYLAREHARSLSRAADGSRQRFEVQSNQVTAKAEHCSELRRQLALSHARADAMKALSSNARQARSARVDDAEEEEATQAHRPRH